jgi:hypothetical protein
MRVNVWNRMVVAAGVGAVALTGLSVSAYASPQRGQTQKEQQTEQQTEQQAQKKQDQAQAKQHHQNLVDQQQQRLTQYRDHLDQQQRLAQAQSAQLQQERRQAPAAYSRDPYFSSPATVRYSRGGRYYGTNQYGVTLLRQAVNYGYDQGYRTGLADHRDRSRSNYGGSFAYQDANFGYTGFYVDRDDYNDYFREGFRRGYEDGYGGHSQYGTYVNGRATILGAILGGILNFQVIVR